MGAGREFIALQLTKRLSDYAVKHHLLVANPATPFNWTDIGGKGGPRSRVLSRAELVAFFKAMKATPSNPAYSPAAFKPLLATGPSFRVIMRRETTAGFRQLFDGHEIY